MLYYTIPYHTILYSYHTIPCYAILYYTILYYAVLYHFDQGTGTVLGGGSTLSMQGSANCSSICCSLYCIRLSLLRGFLFFTPGVPFPYSKAFFLNPGLPFLSPWVPFSIPGFLFPYSRGPFSLHHLVHVTRSKQ